MKGHTLESVQEGALVADDGALQALSSHVSALVHAPGGVVPARAGYGTSAAPTPQAQVLRACQVQVGGAHPSQPPASLLPRYDVTEGFRQSACYLQLQELESHRPGPPPPGPFLSLYHTSQELLDKSHALV